MMNPWTISWQPKTWPTGNFGIFWLNICKWDRDGAGVQHKRHCWTHTPTSGSCTRALAHSLSLTHTHTPTANIILKGENTLHKARFFVSNSPGHTHLQVAVADARSLARSLTHTHKHTHKHTHTHTANINFKGENTLHKAFFFVSY